MALTKNTVTKAIKVVSTDPVASRRIKSILAPILGQHSGFVRNMPFVLAEALTSDGVLGFPNLWMGLPSLWMHKEFNHQIPTSISARLNCDGIANAAIEALNSRISMFPKVRIFTIKSRSGGGFEHAGVWLEMRDNTNYILDWWMTLDIENPIVFKFWDWDKGFKQAGVPYSDFKLFA